MILHLAIAWACYRIGLDRPAIPGRLTDVSLWLSHRARRNAVEARISLPPNFEARTVSLHVWAGF